MRLRVEVDRERDEVGALEADALPVRGNLERIALNHRSVDLDQVGTVTAGGDIGAVAVVPLEQVVARATAHLVAAPVADHAVVAARAVEHVGGLAAVDPVGAVTAGEGVETRAAVQREQNAAVQTWRSGGLVVAGQPIDGHPLGERVEREGAEVDALEGRARSRSPG